MHGAKINHSEHNHYKESKELEYTPPAETSINHVQKQVEVATTKPVGGFGLLAGSGSGLKSSLLSKLES